MFYISDATDWVMEELELEDLEFPDTMRDELRAAWHRYLDLLLPLRQPLFAYCRRLTGSVWDAEDLVQDTLMRGFNTLGKTDHVSNPRAYLLRIATHTWIDIVRRKETALLARDDIPLPTVTAPDASSEVRDASTRLLQRLSPQERAALVLKEVFEMSLEEIADVLGTTLGAVKAALHRGRTRLQRPEGEAPSQRPAPSLALVDRFVELFNARDKAGLIELLLDSGEIEMVGCSSSVGRDAFESEDSWMNGALFGHPEWPEALQFEAMRVERAEFEGEPVVLLFRTRRGREGFEQVMRLEEDAGRIARISDYCFCPETVREVGNALGLRVITGLYRYPSPEPGIGYGEKLRRERKSR